MSVALPLDLAQVERELCKRSLLEFVRSAWHVVEPSPMVDGPHIGLVCAHLEAVSRGECLRLVVNIPPGCSKSLLVSVFWPAWDWIQNPGRRWMNASFDQSLTMRDADRMRDLVVSEWYQARWPEVQIRGLEQVARAKGAHKPRKGAAVARLWTVGGGLRFSTSTRGKATGWHAHIQVMDDPTKPDDIRAGGDVARTALQKTAEAWSGTFASRRADPKTFARVIVMQRLHANDLAATAEAEGYTVLKLPMEYEPTRHCSTPWGQDWRTVRGELLSPGRFDAASVASLRKDLGARHAAAQLDQDPNLEEGSIFQLAWFQRRWTEIPAGCLWFQSWDCAFKDSDGSDYVVGQVWARKGDTYYLVDQRRDRLSFTNTVQAIRDLCAKWPESRRKVLVEDKANGSAVIDTLKTEIPGIEAVTPDGGKTSRAQAVTPLCESGQVLLPADAVWVQDLLVELKDFPLGSHDDQVDTLTQAINHGGGSGVKRKRSRYSAPRPATVSGGIRVFGGTSAELERALKPLRAVGFSRCEALEDGSIRVYCSGDLVLARYCVESRKLGACV